MIFQLFLHVISANTFEKFLSSLRNSKKLLLLELFWKYTSFWDLARNFFYNTEFESLVTLDILQSAKIQPRFENQCLQIRLTFQFPGNFTLPNCDCDILRASHVRQSI